TTHFCGLQNYSRFTTFFFSCQCVSPKAIKLNPVATKAYSWRATAYIMSFGAGGSKDNLNLALNDYTEVIRLDKNSFQAYVDRSMLYSVQGESDLALNDLNKVIQIWEDNQKFSSQSTTPKKITFANILNSENNKTIIDAYHLRGRIYAIHNNYDSAVADLTKAIELYQNKERVDLLSQFPLANNGIAPSFASPYYTRGVIYSARKEFDRAISDFTEALKLRQTLKLPPDENMYLIYFSRGSAYGSKGSNDQAISDLTQAINLAPTINPKLDLTSAYFVRGAAYFNKGDRSNAITDLKQAKLSNDPGMRKGAEDLLQKLERN
ncbi:tetratricopeptide repeat protein, partial [Phormidesmis priestleyi]